MTTKQFNKLSKKKQRILIAEDVLKNIKAKVIIPSSGTYIGSELSDYSGDVQEQFDKIKECAACALGSCLLSTVKFKDSLTFNELDRQGSDSKATKLLLDIFSPNQWALIEKAFEGSRYITMWSNSGMRGHLSEEEVDKAITFHNRYKTIKGRLIGIMKNIIQNKGIFIPNKNG